MFVSSWLYVVISAYWIIMHYWGWLITTCLFLACCVIKYSRIPFIAVLAVSLALLPGLRSKVSNRQVFKIVICKENYAIAANRYNGKIVIYDRGLEYGTLVTVGKLERIAGLKNPLIFNFVDYLENSGIFYQGRNLQVIKKGRELANWLYHKYEKLEPTKWDFVKAVLYQQQNPVFSDDFVYSSGYALRYLLRLFSIPILFFFDRSQHRKIMFLLTALLVLLFPMIISLKIILFYRLFKWLFPEKNIQLIALALILLLWDDSYLLHPTFLFIYLQQFGSFINLGESYLRKKMYLFLIQLLLFKKTNIMLSLLFKAYSQLQAFTLLFAILAEYLPLSLLLWWQKVLVEMGSYSNYFYITTIPSVAVLLVFVWLLSRKNQITELVLPLVLPLIQFQQFFNPFSTVTILDCGQADCTVVALAFNRCNLLLDAGNNFTEKTGVNIIMPYLQKQGIFKIDALVISHNDYDHSGSVSDILNNFNVSQLIYYPQKIREKNFQLFIADDVQKIIDYYGLQSNNENSLIILLQVNRLSLLFLSDVTKLQEEKLIKLYNLSDFQLVKLAHHGSDSGSSSELLDLANWRYALISSGRNNRYGHPSPTVVQRLNDYNLPYFNTAQDGYLRTTTIFDFSFLQTGQGELRIIK